MLSKNQIKRITSLQQKKYRNEYQLFIAEGIKVIQELFQSHYIVEHFYTTNPDLSISEAPIPEIITESDLKKISCLKTPNDCLAVFRIPKPKPINLNGLVVCLDDVRDPGNLGTIIRLCDWFGVEQLVCSPETADVYNPKVIQSTMGSISRVNLVYTDLNKFLENSILPVFGAFMEGENVHESALPEKAILVLGNEANGISKSLESKISSKISIPRFGQLQKTESLNVATASAILLSEFRRNFSEK
jgi:TrmH family RNA methyltransferase